MMRKRNEANVWITGVVIAVVIIGVLSGLFYTGHLGLSVLDNGTTTKVYDRSGIFGNRYSELIGPNSRTAFICSYISTAQSETIVAHGTLSIDTFSTAGAAKYCYKVYLKKDSFSSYELVSAPEITTSSFISQANPGILGFGSLTLGGTVQLKDYSFEVMGPSYSNGAVKVELCVYMQANMFDSFKWWVASSDEAYLYSGWGGLYLPKDANGTHYKSTFEIGEHVKIEVKTSYGAVTAANGTENTWRVTLQKPMSQGGSVYKSQDYGNNVDTFFEFDVTSDMFMLGGDNHWTLQIYNVLVPKGTLQVNTIDFAAKAPGIVTFSGFSGDDQYKVGSQVTCKLSAVPNSGQLPITKFHVCIIYGNNNVLLPSDPLDKLWILPWTDITDISSSSATLSFTPKHQSFVTVHAVAVDSQGRSSITENTHTIWVYDSVPASSGQLGDNTGTHEYGGGSTNTGFQFNPGTADMQDWIGFLLKIIIMLVIIIVVILAGWFLPVPVYGKAIIIIVGIVIAILYFLYAPLISIPAVSMPGWWPIK